MKRKPVVTITISGPKASGKTRCHAVLAALLPAFEAKVKTDPVEGEPRLPKLVDVLKGVRVRLVVEQAK